MDQFLAEVERRAYRIAKASLRDHELALDVVQDSMLRLVEHYRDKSPEEWPPLFFRILSNRINDARRWRMIHGGKKILFSVIRNPAKEQNSTDAEISDALARTAEASGESEQETEIYRTQLREKLDAAIGTLAWRQREVFMLREWLGFSIKETAGILGCTEGSVKQHHFRALQSLRAKLGEDLA